MAKYMFKALAENGELIVRYDVESPGERELIIDQKDKGREVIYVRKTAEKSGVKELSPRELAAFSHELSIMLGSGLNHVRALAIMGTTTNAKYKRLTSICASVSDLITKGHSLSEACRLQGGAFPPLIINAIYSGEESGNMPLVTRRMSDYYERSIKISGKVKSATTYPKILLVMSAVIVFAMFTFILPQFMSSELFADAELPGLTKFMFGLSNFVMKYYIYIGIAVAVIIVSVRFFLKTPFSRATYDNFLVKAPLIGKLMQSIYTSRFAATLSYLHNSGIMIVPAVLISGNATNNLYIIHQVEEAVKQMQRGEMLSAALKKVDGFNSRIVYVSLIGEETGKLGEVLDKMAVSFEEETDAAISGLLTLLTPVLLVVMAVVVGGVAASVMLPIFSIYQGL